MEATSICEDCREAESVADLACKKHRVCADCLVQRAKADPLKVLQCNTCESASTKPAEGAGDEAVRDGLKDSCDPPELPGIFIFVDDSNIWIEAKKLSASKKFKTAPLSEDPRVRIDMGKLADVLANKRPVKQGILYGSEPPPIDTVWKKIEKKGFKVISKRRDAFTGKEKQIDTNIVADITATAIRTPIHERTTIVLVTGDANVLPALEKVIEEERWHVEVYMWKDALSKQLTYYAAQHHKRVEVTPLDKYFDHLAFTNMKFSVSNRDYLLRTVNTCGVVFTMTNKAFKNRVPTKRWFQQLENIAQWPCRYYWFESKSGEETNDLVVVFPTYFGNNFNVTTFLKNINSADQDGYRLPLVLEAQTFHQFMAKEREREQKDNNDPIKKLDAVLEEVGILDRSDIDTSYDEPAVCVTEETEDSGWTVVKRKYQPRRQKFSDECRFGMHCSKGTQCPFNHSDEDKAYFKKRGGQGNPFRKVKPCKYFNQQGRNRCFRSKEDCDGAHGDDDAHCLACGENGHFTDNCTIMKDKKLHATASQ